MNTILAGLVFAAIVIIVYKLAAWLVDALLTGRPYAVYHVNDLYGELLYIGYSYNPSQRLRRHKQRQSLLAPGDPRKWWPRVGPNGQEFIPDFERWYPNKEAAHQAEVAAIRRLNPPANRIKYKSNAIEEG